MPALQGVRGEGLLAPRGRRRRCKRFTLLRVDLTREDDDPALGAIKKKYGADTLPAIRLVAPDGKLRGKTDELMSAQAFRELLLATRATP